MIAVLDTETTGLDPTAASVLELAVVTLPDFTSFSCLVKPEHDIELEALATHHISAELAATGAPFEEAIAAGMINEADFIAAHNAEFDSGFVKMDKPWICTYRCARHLYPDATSHKNQVLRYYLKLDDIIHATKEGKLIMDLPPHRALPDAWVTAHILNHMLATHTPQELVELTKAPILIKNVAFGKHRGLAWADVPKDYLRWLIRAGDFDKDSIYTAKHYLGMV